MHNNANSLTSEDTIYYIMVYEYFHNYFYLGIQFLEK